MVLTVCGTLLLAQAAAPPAEVRSVLVSVTDARGVSVSGLSREEVVVLENGVAREPSRVVPDDRPLTVAVLVDTSLAVGSSYRLNLVDAIGSFVNRLPEGSRYALWTTGDRPTKVVDYTTNPEEAPRALKRVPPIGGNTLLDALFEASRDLKKQEGARAAVVAVTGLGPEMSFRDRHAVVDESKKSGAVFYAIQLEDVGGAFEDRQAYEYALSRLTEDSAGLYDTLLSSMGASAALQKVAADLGSQYRVSYVSVPEAKLGKLEVKVARPGLTVRVGQRFREER